MGGIDEHKSIRDIIINTVKDLVSNFMYYDRKEDPELSVNNLRGAISGKVISSDEIIKVFSEELKTSLGED